MEINLLNIGKQSFSQCADSIGDAIVVARTPTYKCRLSTFKYFVDKYKINHIFSILTLSIVANLILLSSSLVAQEKENALHSSKYSRQNITKNLYTQSFSEESQSLTNKDIKLFTDWSKFSFADMQPVMSSGSVNQELNNIAGWDVSRSWNSGDNITNILKLGDLNNSLSPQLLSVKNIYARLNMNPDNVNNLTDVKLADFKLIQNQSLGSLVNSIDNLGKYTAREIQPIADALKSNGYSDALNLKLETIIKNNNLANLNLNSLDLSKYSLESIPNLVDTQLEKFVGYQESFLSEIPGLANLPLSQFPNPISPPTDIVARIDFIWGDAENNVNNTISGSIVEGFNVSCETKCGNLELDDPENRGRSANSSFEGKRWVNGKHNMAEGGTGCLSGGKEPVGIHPYKNAFKVVLWETNENSNSAQIVMFYNIQTKCGDSPYFIGPFPYAQGFVNVNDFIFLGIGS